MLTIELVQALFHRLAKRGLSLSATMAIWLGCLASTVVSAQQGVSTQASGPGTFRNFAGTCQGGPNVPQLYDLVGWDRADISWSKLEPRKGEWNQNELEKWGQRILDMQAKGVKLLPILCYNASWSWDRAEQTYDLGDERVHVKPLPGGKYLVETSRRVNGVWTVVESKQERPNDHWPLAQENEAAWGKYVRRVVGFFRKAPYNVEYFQIWNEAYPTSDFWGHGDLDAFMTRVHIPASKIIRELGGKVVYGGWPCCGSIQDYVATLDRNHAWSTIDVLDIHYFPLSAFEYLHQAASKRGYDSIGIWQTELGFSTDPEFIGNTYPRFLAWCLGHDWDYADRYKLFFFCGFTPDDPKAYGYQRALVQGNGLSPHGLSLQTLGDAFSAGKLTLYDGITTRPVLNREINENNSSMEAFKVGDKKLVAVIHLVENNDAKIFTDWNGGLGTMHLDFDSTPMMQVDLPRFKPNQIASIDRVDLAGRRLTLEAKTAEASGTRIDVPIRDQQDSPANQWFGKSNVRSFLVEVTLN